MVYMVYIGYLDAANKFQLMEEQQLHSCMHMPVYHWSSILFFQCWVDDKPHGEVRPEVTCSQCL